MRSIDMDRLFILALLSRFSFPMDQAGGSGSSGTAGTGLTTCTAVSRMQILMKKRYKEGDENMRNRDHLELIRSEEKQIGLLFVYYFAVIGLSLLFCCK